jgi:hypothetical protein
LTAIVEDLRQSSALHLTATPPPEDHAGDFHRTQIKP